MSGRLGGKQAKIEGQHRQEIGRICKHVGGKTTDGVPSAENQRKMSHKQAKFRQKSPFCLAGLFRVSHFRAIDRYFVFIPGLGKKCDYVFIENMNCCQFPRQEFAGKSNQRWEGCFSPVSDNWQIFFREGPSGLVSPDYFSMIVRSYYRTCSDTRTISEPETINFLDSSSSLIVVDGPVTFINPFLPDCKTSFSRIFFIFLCYL